jgi:hypothetical protein
VDTGWPLSARQIGVKGHEAGLAFPICSRYPPPMPRDFITLSDMSQTVLGIVCDLCQRREQFDVEALRRQHGGDVKMPELLSRLVADCPRQQAFSIYDRCRVIYDERSRYVRRTDERPSVAREGER